MMDVDGGNPRNLTKNRHDDDAPSWSPDGKRIAFTSARAGNSEIYMMNADGSNPRNLTKNFERSCWEPSWSPTGKHIAFYSATQEDGAEIYVMDANGQNHRKLTDNHWLDNSPSWSADGKHITFASTKLANWDIYVMEADGGNPQNLTNNPFAHDRQPAWYSPAFSVAPAGKQFTMWGWLKQVVR
jgi:Tol biopolymer transport system component